VRGYSLLLLDLDGTLLDTRLDLVEATNHVRSTFGSAPLGVGEVERLVGDGARRLVERALGAERAHVHDQGVRRFLDYYTEHCLDQTLPYPGMVDLLETLPPLGIRAAIVTNKPEALTRKILAGLGLLERMVAVVGGDTFPERKPHPRGAESVRALCRVERSETLLAGDSAVDAATAQAAGIAFCGVAWGFDPQGLRAAAPERMVRSARELQAVIHGESTEPRRFSPG
jgi:phosphoglycolate phosphatase